MEGNNIMQENQIILSEQFNIVNALKLLQSDLIDEETKASLSKYLSYSKNQKVDVLYKLPEDGIGRLNIRINDIKVDKDGSPKDTCRCQYNMYNLVKASICDKYYVDLDIKNCHPSILLQVFKKNKLQCVSLEKFVNQRDRLFAKFYKVGIHKPECKKLFMAIFYGGSIKNWCNKNKFDFTVIPKLFTDLEKEITEGRETLMTRDENYKYMEKAHKKCEEMDCEYNLKGKALSYFIQSIECSLLMKMYYFITSNNYIVGSLIHDGLHLRKLQDDSQYGKLISSLEEHLLKESGYEIQLAIKPFNVPDALDNIIIIENDEEAGILISDMLKETYIECDNREFYKKDNIWTTDDKVIRKEIKKFIYSQNFFIQTKNKLQHYSKMTSGMNNILGCVSPTKDEFFIDKLFKSNLGKLCFNNGYWDFEENKLKPYDNTIATCVKINKDYSPSSTELKQEVMDRVFNPIFANDAVMLKCWLNTLARAIAGHIEDKNWIVNMGERNCGKSVLVGIMESAFGGYVRTTNGENFIFKNSIGESSKALSWLIPFEFKRIITTNEITRDAENKYKINGNILKKLASGGDVMEARVNHKDEINFKIQARPFIFCNDLPPIEPADAKETSINFNFPSKFVDDDHPQFGQTTWDGGNVLCSFQKKDDTIKEWARRPDVVQAFTDIVFEHYGKLLPLPDRIAADSKDFSEAENEYQAIDDLFSYMGSSHQEYNHDTNVFETKPITEEHHLTAKKIKYLVEKNNINMSSQKYNKYLISKGCIRGQKGIDGKVTKVVFGIVLVGEDE